MIRSGIRLWLCFASLALAACGAPVDVGETCADTADCIEGLSCFEHVGADPSPVCMPDCTLGASRFCDNGAVCTRAIGADRPADQGVCYLGGTVAVGSDCADNLECVRGAICVARGALDAQLCFRACSTDDAAACEEGETCSPLAEMDTNGFCEVL